MKKLLSFLRSQQLLTIASHDAKNVWLANVYYSIDDQGTIYFISPKKNRHSQMMLKNPKVAFSVAWFDPKNHQNRKAVQGLGVCRPAKTPQEIATGIRLLYKNFPDLREILTIKWIMTNAWGTKVWIVQPSYMKHWNDELYGEKESKEFVLK